MAWDADAAIPYGEDRHGVEHEIHEVTHGHFYACPNCKEQLSTVLNVTAMRPHFRHHKDRAKLPCEWRTSGGRERAFGKIREASIARYGAPNRMRVYAVQTAAREPTFALRAALPTLLPSEFLIASSPNAAWLRS